MERRELLTWLLGISFVGILCVCLFGRPGPNEGSGFSWVYTVAPTNPPLAAAAIASAITGTQNVVVPASASALSPLAAASPAATPSSSSLEEGSAAAAAITTAPTPFVANSVVNTSLKEGIATLASKMPGFVIRPYQMGTTLPPGPYNEKRVNVGYDPVSLTITQVTTG